MKSDFRKMGDALKRETEKALQKKRFETECPHCHGKVTAPAGKSVCPNCGKEIDLTIEING